MSEFGGLWKHQNSPACTNSVNVFRMLKLDTVRKKKEDACFFLLLFSFFFHKVKKTITLFLFFVFSPGEDHTCFCFSFFSFFFFHQVKKITFLLLLLLGFFTR